MRLGPFPFSFSLGGGLGRSPKRRMKKRGRSPLVAAALAVILDGAASLASSPFCVRPPAHPFAVSLVFMSLCSFLASCSNKNTAMAPLLGREKRQDLQPGSAGSLAPGSGRTPTPLFFPLCLCRLLGTLVARRRAAASARAHGSASSAKADRVFFVARARHLVFSSSSRLAARRLDGADPEACHTRANGPGALCFWPRGNRGRGIERDRIRAPQRCARPARPPWP